MPSRWIIAGLAAVFAVGGSSVYAANSHGQAVSTLARSTTLDGRAHGEAVSDLASEHAASVHAVVSIAPVKSQPQQAAPSSGCAGARSAFTKLLADQRAEDQAEREADRTGDQAEPAGSRRDDQAEQSKRQAEDRSELTAMLAALKALVAACGDRDLPSQAVVARMESGTEAAGAGS